MVLGLCLMIFCFPNKIALAVNFQEAIVLLVPKYLVLINLILPLAIAIAIIFFKQKNSVCRILKLLFTLLIYENMLIFIYFSFGENIAVDSISEIPLAISIGMPASVIILFLATKLKHTKFNSKLAINTKYTRESEFIWMQIHFFASNVFSLVAIILFACTIPFLFVRMFYIWVVLCIVSLATGFLIVFNESKKMYNKQQTLIEHQKKHEQKMKEFENQSKETSKN